MDSELPDKHPIDDLVRDHLEQQAEQEDTTALTARVLASVSTQDSFAVEPESPAAVSHINRITRRLMKPIAYLAASAAAVLIAFVVGRMNTTAYASAATLVRAAVLTHSEPIERCYVVTVERENEDRL